MMFGISLWLLVVIIVAGTLASVTGLYAFSKFLEKRVPYGSFIHLRTRQKIRFFRLLISDKRVPRPVKALPILLIPYLAMPFDLIPDFIPVLGYVDDVAIVLGLFALVIRLSPRSVIDDILRLSAVTDAN
jgi:uncharacterized membrane protein YkvA (DUF1232 family)